VNNSKLECISTYLHICIHLNFKTFPSHNRNLTYHCLSDLLFYRPFPLFTPNPTHPMIIGSPSLYTRSPIPTPINLLLHYVNSIRLSTKFFKFENPIRKHPQTHTIHRLKPQPFHPSPRLIKGPNPLPLQHPIHRFLLYKSDASTCIEELFESSKGSSFSFSLLTANISAASLEMVRSG